MLLAVCLAQAPVELDHTGTFGSIGGEFARMAFSFDGARMVSVGERGDLMLWDTATWTPTARSEAVGRSLSAYARGTARSTRESVVPLAVALHPDKDLAVACYLMGSEGYAEVLDFAAGTRRRLWHEDPRSVVFALDGRLVVSSGLSLSVLPSAAAKQEEETLVALPGVSLHPNPFFLGVSNQLCVASSAGKCCVVDLADLEAGVHEFPAIAAMYPNGERVEFDRRSIRWKGKWVRHEGRRGFATSLGGSHAAFRGGNRATLWRITQDGTKREKETRDLGSGLAVSERGTIACARMSAGCVILDGANEIVIGGHVAPAANLEFSPDGKYVAATGSGASVVADLGGKVRARWHREGAVTAGMNGPEFVFVAPRSIRAWNARTQSDLYETALPETVRPWLRYHDFHGQGQSARVLRSDAKLVLLSGGAGTFRRESSVRIDARTGKVAALDVSNASSIVYSEPVGVSVHEKSGQFSIYRDISAVSERNALFRAKHHGAVEFFDFPGNRLGRLDFKCGISAVDYSPDGGWMLAADGLGIHLIDVAARTVTAGIDHKGLRWAGFVTDDFALVHDGSTLFSLGVPDLSLIEMDLPGVDKGKLGAARIAPKRDALAIGVDSEVRVYRIKR